MDPPWNNGFESKFKIYKKKKKKKKNLIFKVRSLEPMALWVLPMFEPMTWVSLNGFKGFKNYQAITYIVLFYAIFMYITFYVKHLKNFFFFF